MGIRLYQSFRRSPDEALGVMLGRLLGRGHGGVVRLGSLDSARMLSDFLWGMDGFLPHGVSGVDTIEHQRLWLTYADGGDDDFAVRDCLFLADGVLPNLDDGSDSDFGDIVIIFGERDSAVVESMRIFWRGLKERDLSSFGLVDYWSDEGGSWAEKATLAGKAEDKAEGKSDG